MIIKARTVIGIVGIRTVISSQKHRLEGAMSNLIELTVGQIGARYMISCLEGEVGLASLMANQIAVGGSVTTIVPAGTELARAEQFEVGGLMSRRCAMKWLIGLIRSQQAYGLYFVAQDIWANVADASLNDRTIRRFLLPPSGVYFYTDPGATEENIEKTIASVSSYLFFAVITKIEDRERISSGVSDDFLEKLAENASLSLVSTYDQESFVVWKRS